MASNLIGTLLSSQVTDARTTRPGTFVPIGCDPALSGLALFFFCSCFALDLSRSAALSQFLAPGYLKPGYFRLVSFAFRISDLSRSFPRPALPPGLRSASELAFRCGAPELYRYLFPSPNRPFIERSPEEISMRRHQETTTPPTPFRPDEGKKATTGRSSGLLLKITPGDRPLARRVPKGQRRENLVGARAHVKPPDPGRVSAVRGVEHEVGTGPRACRLSQSS